MIFSIEGSLAQRAREGATILYNCIRTLRRKGSREKRKGDGNGDVEGDTEREVDRRCHYFVQLYMNAVEKRK